MNGIFKMAWVMAVACSSPILAFAGELPEGVSGFVEKYCVSCHGPDEQKGDFRIDELGVSETAADAASWQLVLDNLYLEEMPPAKHPLQPEFAEVEPITDWIESELQRARLALQGQTGEVVLRRLNRAEYENTIADLFDVHGSFAAAFPEDATSHGFNMIGAVLMLSAAQLDEYTRAANYVLDQVLALGTEAPTRLVESSLHRVNERSWKHYDQNLNRTPEQLSLLNENGQARYRKAQEEHAANPNLGYTLYAWENGQLREPLRGETEVDLALVQQNYSSNALDTQLFFGIKKPGWYRYTVRAYSARNNGQPVRLHFEHNSGWGAASDHSSPIETFYVPPGEPQEFEVRVYMMPRDNITLRMLDGPPNMGRNKNPIEADSPVIVIRSDVMEGPIFDEWPPRGVRTLFGSLDPADSAPDNIREIIRHFGGTLFRRPIDPQTADLFLTFYEQQAADLPHDEALKNMLVAMMISPRFLYQLEPPGTLDAFALASRLSYFLWRSTPDAQLLAAAASGDLLVPEKRSAEIERMIEDPRSKRFIRDFTGQWLRVNEVGEMRADPNLYPEYDQDLELAIAEETHGFIAELFYKNLPLHNLIDSDWTILNERLAKHYGIPGVEGPEFRRVALDKSNTIRGGLLTHASMHAVTSNGTNTSPIHRGIWVLENFLGTPPPPPPPDVPAIEPDIRGATSILDQLAKHRDIPACASCHARIDPLGVALENFDVIGGWRDHYRGLQTTKGGRPKIVEGVPVVSAAALVGGSDFETFEEFRAMLMERRDLVTTNVAQKMATFALGRELDFADRDDIAEIVQTTHAHGGGMRTMIHALVQSPLFLKP